MSAPFKAGDTVKHGPTGETWVVAYCDQRDLMPCGWPATWADAKDCELVKSCTSEESIALLKRMADGRHDDSRSSRAERELIRLRVPEYVEKERRSLLSAIAGLEQQMARWKEQLAALEAPNEARR